MRVYHHRQSKSISTDDEVKVQKKISEAWHKLRFVLAFFW